MIPLGAPFAGAEFIAANRKVPISMKIDAETTVIFFKNYTRILGLLKKAVRLRLATVAPFHWPQIIYTLFPLLTSAYSRQRKLRIPLDPNWGATSR